MQLGAQIAIFVLIPAEAVLTRIEYEDPKQLSITNCSHRQTRCTTL